jgi:hypothetical protein
VSILQNHHGIRLLNTKMHENVKFSLGQAPALQASYPRSIGGSFPKGKADGGA